MNAERWPEDRKPESLGVLRKLAWLTNELIVEIESYLAWLAQQEEGTSD